MGQWAYNAQLVCGWKSRVPPTPHETTPHSLLLTKRTVAYPRCSCGAVRPSKRTGGSSLLTEERTGLGRRSSLTLVPWGVGGRVVPRHLSITQSAQDGELRAPTMRAKDKRTQPNHRAVKGLPEEE